jgi:uncharacterized membrane-anchored protein
VHMQTIYLQPVAKDRFLIQEHVKTAVQRRVLMRILTAGLLFLTINAIMIAVMVMTNVYASPLTLVTTGGLSLLAGLGMFTLYVHRGGQIIAEAGNIDTAMVKTVPVGPKWILLYTDALHPKLAQDLWGSSDPHSHKWPLLTR